MLYFRYLDNDADADLYQGHDYSRVYVEELTQFPSPGAVDKLKATLRSAAGAPCGFRATCNPGGPGHNWVKARYIDPGPKENGVRPAVPSKGAFIAWRAKLSWRMRRKSASASRASSAV